MNHNLAVPFNDKPSPPLTAYLAFYSHQAEDMMFSPEILGQDQEIEIRCQAGLRSVGLRWTLHRNMVLKPFLEGEAEATPANGFILRIDAEKLPAGFYDLRVTLDTGAEAVNPNEVRPVKGVCVFGWRAEEMAIRETRPTDFVEFWDKAKAELAEVDLDARDETEWEVFDAEGIGQYNLKKACLPADYDPRGHIYEEVSSAKVSFAAPDGGRVYGWLAKPETSGQAKFPAMLVLPGAGFAARPRPLEHARHGFVALDIQIHGQDVDLTQYEEIPGYHNGQIFEPARDYYYYKIHLRVLQAINYLASRPDVDASRIVVVGGSQGGRLGIVAAGLDARVAAVVSCIANSPNQPQLAWVAKCNGLDGTSQNPNDPNLEDRVLSDGMDLKEAPPIPDTPAGRGFAYFDPMNYAPDIRCPVLINGGLTDPVSPPFSVWAVSNRLGTADKTVVALPGLAHDWSAEFDRRAWKWLKEKLG